MKNIYNKKKRNKRRKKKRKKKKGYKSKNYYKHKKNLIKIVINYFKINKITSKLRGSFPKENRRVEEEKLMINKIT